MNEQTNARQGRFGVLLMAYGTPRQANQVEAYYTHIRHGHPPTQAQLANLLARYEAIGGLSPLNEITAAEARELEAGLAADGGRPAKVYLGMKHAAPFIDEAVRQMAADGVTSAVALVLAPHYSRMSVGEYLSAAEDAGAAAGVRLLPVQNWHDRPDYLALIEQRVQNALAKFDSGKDTMVVFSAHSLPERILAAGDPYERQLHETGEAVAHALQLPHHRFAWQSAGRTNDKWLGPDILDVLRELASDGWRQVLLCPIGFVSDHLEILYDVDIEAQAVARKLGLHLERMQSLNADPEFIQVLRQVVRDREAAAEALQ